MKIKVRILTRDRMDELETALEELIQEEIDRAEDLPVSFDVNYSMERAHNNYMSYSALVVFQIPETGYEEL